MKRKISPIVKMHYCKLIFRSGIFLGIAALYFSNKLSMIYKHCKWLIYAVCTCFIIEMIFRFFPSKLESMGCQKPFAKNYRPRKCSIDAVNKTDKSVYLVALVWIALNAVFGILYFFKIINIGILILISMFYSVSDMICILFFCPFQTWFMKNKCCTTCRIYNWDFAMMTTPLLFIINRFTILVIIPSMLLLIKWEYSFHRYPERFSESGNCNLSCENCREKLCTHKKQLQALHRKYRINIHNK